MDPSMVVDEINSFKANGFKAYAPVTVKAIKQAYAILEQEKVAGLLIGTSALWLMGFDVEPHDIDFLVVKAPKGDGIKTKMAAGSTEESATTEVEGAKVDYVPWSGLRARYFCKGMEIGGVPVATLEAVLGLKRLADRRQDRDFLYRWSYGLVGLIERR